MSHLYTDLKYALRKLAKTPGFAVVAVLTLAISIGATVAIFGIVNELLFKPRGVSHSDELAAVGFLDADDGSLTMINILRPYYEVFREEQKAFSDLIGFAIAGFKMERGDGSEWVRGELVSGSYFQTLGVKPVLGRPLLPADDEKPGQGAVAVIGHAFWQRHFHADPNVIGQTLRLENQVVEIVGVAPKAFAGLDAWPAEVWLPTTLEPLFQEHVSYRLVGRLAPDVSRVQAQADLRRVSQLLSEMYGKRAPSGYYSSYGANHQVVLLSAGRGSVSPFHSKKAIWRAFLLFMGASGLVLLIGCSNFTSLLLVRSLKNRKETATRLALGARRRRIVSGSLIESLLLAGLGGIVAIVLAIWLNHILVLWKPAHVRFMAEIALDWRILTFCVVTALGAGFLCGLVPAFQSVRLDVFQVLKSETILEAGHRRGFQFKHWLVASQLALCLVLLLGAGLCLRSFAKLLSLDPGFDTKHTIVATANLEQAGYTPENSPAALTEIIQRVRALPGVTRVTFSGYHPLYGAKFTSILRPRPGEEFRFNTARVGPDFFRTVGMPLLQGKELSLRDFGSDQEKALVNESFVRRYWPDQEVLGERFGGREVIGIVQDSRVFDLTEEPAPLVFEQVANLNGQRTHLLIRTDGKAKAVLPSITAILTSLDPRLSSVVPRTMQEIVLNSLGSQRYTLTLMAVFAGIALILAVVGIYGLMAYMVSLMNREVGIRLSLGAQRQDIINLVLHFGLKVIALGTLIGVPCCIIATRFIRSELYEVHPLHPLVLGIATGLLGVVALIACWLPARRAAKIDPMEALRCE